jgi:hypothetical protein
MSNLYGVAAYQQTSQAWNQSTKKTDTTTKKQATDKSGNTSSSEAATKTDTEIKKTTWTPIDTTSSLVPTYKEGVGLAVGDVQLSDKAKEYYSQLKAKFNTMEFIAVSQDMKSQVQANAASYGNASKQVVLIDDAKLELMANDESFRKKYEGIIAMSQMQLSNAKNSLASSGASVKNFGMSVNSDGSTSYFATVEKSSDAQTKRLQKKQEEKKAAKAKEKKQTEKKQIEKKKAEKKEKEEKLEKAKEEKVEAPEKDYIEIKADSMKELVNKVAKYAYETSSKSVLTEEEKSVGQKFDFKG